MSYEAYCDYARVKGFQPLCIEAFNAMKAVGFFN
jgi:hypothetical protein